MKKHLAILSKAAINQIFEGKKTIESRFSQKRISPFGLVNIGDLVYLKPAGEDIVGQFKVKKVIYFEGLDELDWEVIEHKYAKEISLGTTELDTEFFSQRKKANFATLIFIDNVERFIASPIKIKKRDLRGWVVLEN